MPQLWRTAGGTNRKTMGSGFPQHIKGKWSVKKEGNKEAVREREEPTVLTQSQTPCGKTGTCCSLVQRRRGRRRSRWQTWIWGGTVCGPPCLTGRPRRRRRTSSQDTRCCLETKGAAEYWAISAKSDENVRSDTVCRGHSTNTPSKVLFKHTQKVEHAADLERLCTVTVRLYFKYNLWLWNRGSQSLSQTLFCSLWVPRELPECLAAKRCTFPPPAASNTARLPAVWCWTDGFVRVLL